MTRLSLEIACKDCRSASRYSAALRSVLGRERQAFGPFVVRAWRRWAAKSGVKSALTGSSKNLWYAGTKEPSVCSAVRWCSVRGAPRGRFYGWIGRVSGNQSSFDV